MTEHLIQDILFNYSEIRLSWNQMEFFKSAKKINELLNRTLKKTKSKSKEVNPTLKRSMPKLGRWTFEVISTDNYNVRFKLIPNQTLSHDVKDYDVLVSCSCPAWKWNGADFRAQQEGYSEQIKSDGPKIKPKIRDPKGHHILCKHAIAAGLIFKNITLEKPFLPFKGKRIKYQ